MLNVLDTCSYNLLWYSMHRTISNILDFQHLTRFQKVWSQVYVYIPFTKSPIYPTGHISSGTVSPHHIYKRWQSVRFQTVWCKVG